MRVAVGKELEFVMNRLKDISYLSNNARSADPDQPDAVQKMLGDLAREAMPILKIAMSLK